MDFAGLNFYLHIQDIFVYCNKNIVEDEIEISDKDGKSKFYVLSFFTRENRTWTLLLFSDYKEARKFVEMFDKLVTKTISEEQFINTDFNCVFLTIEHLDDYLNSSITSVRGCGEYKEYKLTDKFIKEVLDVLNQREIEIKYKQNKERVTALISGDLLNKLALRAIKEFPTYHKRNLITIYDSKVNGREEFFVAVDVKDLYENAKAAFLIFPKENDAKTFLNKYFEVLNEPTKTLELDAILLVITEENGSLRVGSEGAGRIKEYSDDEREEVCIGCLLEIESFAKELEEFLTKRDFT